jgi:thiamine-phosphate pyrophosphorylase
VIRCLITNGNAESNPALWIEHLAYWMEQGVELVQIREREMSARNLAELTRKVLRLPNPRGTKVLVNDRADVAIACGAHGVHLRDSSAAPKLFARPGFLVTVSCHSVADLDRTKSADFILLAPVFTPLSKRDNRPPLGTQVISEITRLSATPVLALGGITSANADLCIKAGAAGVAGISYFNVPSGRSFLPV